jgi:hypothetical protein
MSSAIPARLLFQCGHAALVTLPRVKGETAAQRNERVAREKSSALARQCDFCGPMVDVALQTNGSHLEVAEVLAAEPVVVADEEPVVLLVEEPVEVVEDPVVVIVEEPVEVIEEPVVVIVEEPVFIVEERVPAEPILIEVVEEEEVAQPRQKRRGAAGRRTSRKQHFAVEYRVERVVRAANIGDAVRRATALGASDILSVERITD